eukprot:CAMPEP_0184005656 /NCGR_PEP_ID=MMETSP0954-20121128/191_1 /TAXON_ID=627963 /ORGANISM="Aplanochytrium sp, Strain PBS07" /LENGTH=380 /DNA_ID=CAMNT_0026283983 /DNA_START=76 /DNA_END=1215 /DNA_ORIENTATION=-
MLSAEVVDFEETVNVKSSKFASLGQSIRFDTSSKEAGIRKSEVEDQLHALVERFYSGCTLANKGQLDRITFSGLFAQDDETSKIWFTRFYDKISREKLSKDFCLDVHTFTEEASKFLHLSDEERLDYTICLFDLDCDGFISSEELLPLVKASFVTSSLNICSENLKNAVDVIVQSSGSFRDIEKGGGLTYAECKSLFGKCLKNLGVSDTIDEKDLARSNLPEQDTCVVEVNSGYTCNSCMTAWQRVYQKIKVELQDNTARVVWLFVFILLNIIVFVCKFMIYYTWERYQPARDLLKLGVNFARSFGQVAMFNMMLIFWPVSRKLMGFMRDKSSFRFWRWIPFNDNITFHMITGHMVMLSGLGHVGAHLYNFHLYHNEPNE